jgi:HEAT repeat protein
MMMTRKSQTFIAALCSLAMQLHAQAPNAQASIIDEQARNQAHRSSQQRASADNRKPTEAEALAIAALRALMSAPPERALPLLERTLRAQKSDLVKARALFVLGQIDSPAARALLLKNALELRGPLQLEAIRAVGIGGDVASLKSLVPIYLSGNAEQQESVVTALTIANNKALMAQLAVQSKNSEQREVIITRLAALGAVSELRQLAAQGVGGINLARAYAIADDLDGVLKIARTDADPAARLEAIQSLGILRNDGAKQALIEIYQSTKLSKEKAAALNGLLIAGDQAAVLKLYRAAQNAQDKRELLRTLGIMGGDAAIEAIDAALEGKQP